MFCGCTYSIKMAGDYECLDTVKALSSQEVNKLNAPQLKKALITILTAGEPSESNLFSCEQFENWTAYDWWTSVY